MTNQPHLPSKLLLPFPSTQFFSLGVPSSNSQPPPSSVELPLPIAPSYATICEPVTLQSLPEYCTFKNKYLLSHLNQLILLLILVLTRQVTKITIYLTIRALFKFNVIRHQTQFLSFQNSVWCLITLNYQLYKINTLPYQLSNIYKLFDIYTLYNTFFLNTHSKINVSLQYACS